jgi:hypothetical protein
MNFISWIVGLWRTLTWRKEREALSEADRDLLRERYYAKRLRDDVFAKVDTPYLSTPPKSNKRPCDYRYHDIYVDLDCPVCGNE